MPTYTYRCSHGHDVEAVQSFTDAPLTECPECGAPLRKTYGSVGIVFKGSGFYRTDSRGGSSASEKSSDKSTASASSGSSSSDSGSSSSSSSNSSSTSGSSGTGSGSPGSSSSGGSSTSGSGTAA